MEIHALSMHLSDADLTTLSGRFVPPESRLEDITVIVTPDGVCVRGVYPLLVNVTFESWWQLDVVGGKVSANLHRLKALGMPAIIFKSAILKALEELAKREFWLEIHGEHVRLDVDYLASRDACPTRVNLRSLRCGNGVLIVEAGKEASR